MKIKHEKIKVFSPKLIQNEQDYVDLKYFLEKVNVEIKNKIFSELTIFDDGSDEEWKEKYKILKEKYPWLKIKFNEKNIGVAKTLLKAYGLFAEDCHANNIIVRLDSDNEHDPSKIKELVSKIKDNVAGAICQIEYKEEHQDRMDRLFNISQGMIQGRIIFGDKELKHNCPGFCAYRCKILKEAIKKYKEHIENFKTEYRIECKWGGDIVMMFIVNSLGYEINLDTMQESIHRAPNRTDEKILDQLVRNSLHLQLMNKMKRK